MNLPLHAPLNDDSRNIVMPDYEKAARFLFDILDNIDTVDDWAKGNDAA